MARRKRSDDFYSDIHKSDTNVRRDNVKVGKRKKTRKNNNKKRKNPLKRFLFSILFIALLVLGIYQIHVNNPLVTLEKAELAIKEDNSEDISKYFDKMGEIIDVLKTSYSDDIEEQNEFDKANFSKFKITYTKKEKTENGLELIVDVENINYITVFDKLDKEDSKNLHRNYIKALDDENDVKKKKNIKLILKRNFTGYKIYESRDFVNLSLGEALSFADDTK